mgnify:FL=1
MLKIRCLLLLSLITSSLWASEFLPELIYQTDSRFTHHILLVEKSTHSLYLYENKDNSPQLLKTYKIATGKVTGNKLVQGDKKTPEGIYFFRKFRPTSELVSSYGKPGLIYGAGAFTMDYPNLIDKSKGKTGGGIWLHSTDDDKRVSKGLDSKGCVVATDSDIRDISKYIDIKNTPIIVTENLRFLKKETWITNKNKISNTIISWAKAWKEKDFQTYINQYSKTDFKSRTKGNFYAYKRYKSRIFSRPDKPSIQFSNIAILNYNEYAVVILQQNYQSNTINDIGKKILFLKQNDKYQWKIISETWEKIDLDQELFSPSLRFFANESSKESDDTGSI